MAELRTEEEQVEAIKNWWKQNGSSLLLGVALAVALVLGWQAWQRYQTNKATEASINYQNLVEAVLVLRSTPEDSAQSATASHLAQTLKSDFSDSGYAAMAALLMARVAVDAGDLEAALTELDWVRQNADQEELKQLALLRSARVKLAQGDAEAARALLDAADQRHYVAVFNELRGDVYAALGQPAEARAAYDEALKTADRQAQSILRMKRDNLATGEQS